MYRAFHAPIRTAEGGLLRNAQGRPTNAVYIFVTMLRKLLNEHKPQFIAASFDLPGRTFRDDLAADYKANRAPMPDELAEQIPMVHAACEALGVPILTSERYEADDVIGTLTVKAAAAGFDVAIVTGDKDFFQLVRDGIRVFNPREEGTWYDAAGVKEKFGVAPDQVVDVLALMGDTIDNIKGVPGIGEKGARELISKYGSLENLIAHAAEVTAEALSRSAARQRRVGAPEPRAARIRTDVPVEFDPDALRYRGASRERCFEIFNELGFRTLVVEYAPTADTIAKTLPARQHRGGRGGARRAAEGARALRAARAARPAVGDARGDRRPRVLDRAARGRSTCRPGIARSATPRSLPIGDVLDGAQAAARRRRDREGRPRSEVRHHRARAPRRHAARARHRHDARELSARRRRVRRIRSKISRSSTRATRRSPRRTSAAAAPRRCRWPMCRSKPRSTTPASAPISPGSSPRSSRRCSRRSSSSSSTTTLERPLIPVLAAVERAGVPHRRSGARRAVAAHRPGADAADAGDLRARRRRVQHQLAAAAGGSPVRQAAAAGPEADGHVEGALDRRRSARGAGARPRPAAPDPRMARADEAEGHLHRRAAAAGQPGDRPGAHLLQPGGGRHRPPEQQRSEPAEHPDPHRARARDPPRLHRRARQRADLRRLLADRVPRARAPGRRRRADRRVPAGRRLPRADGAEDLRRRQRPRSARAPRAPPRWSTTRCSTERRAFTLAKDIGVTPQAAQEFIDAYFAGFPRVRAFIDRTLEEARAHRRRQDDVRAAAAGARADQPRLPAPIGRRARGGQPADSGHGRRHHEARDDRRARRARGRPRTRG